MSNMINVSSGFQYSVNIEYDLNNDDKLKNFIPTKSALTLLEDILLSTNSLSTERSRILVGAYGKGKSHIMLMILSILMKRDLALFQKALPKIKEDKRLYQGVLNYYEQDKKILPVIITGSNTSLPQAFLLSLQRTLQVNGLSHIMPETNFDAAIAVINRWEDEFPETYNKFVELVDSNIDDFVDELKDYNNSAYKKFEKIYPLLTAGSSFNPFLGFDIVELYESVAKEISKEGYSGIFVVYDEFSKYLESNIGSTSVSDTKMLQDFAEKCNRSGNLQLHLMLISHKEISNYIDKLPKAKVDGWRGVSDRFLHVHLNNNFTQTYEIIASVIHHEDKSWNGFKKRFYKEFQSVRQRYAGHNIFSEELDSELNMIIEGCYPLHPVSTFILPRLSDKVAQNERTLFTFLSAEGKSTLPTYLEQINNDEKFELLTPDIIFDYFEPQFKKEVYSDDIHNEYVLTKNILEKVDESSLEGKIVKTISLIYLLEQFEKLAPTKDEIVGIFSAHYTLNTIDKAINNLIEKELVVYVKRSNDFLQLKQSSMK